MELTTVQTLPVRTRFIDYTNDTQEFSESSHRHIGEEAVCLPGITFTQTVHTRGNIAMVNVPAVR